MLLQFNFKNFKSFRDDTTLDLTATKITDYNYHVISIGNERILPVACIYGANASGKSNVIEAFNYMYTYVIHSLNFGGTESSTSKKKKKEFLKPTPFLFDNSSKNAESSFEVYFIDSEANGAKTYNYGFTVDHTGINEEWLNYATKSSRGSFKRIIYRKGNHFDFPGIPKKSQENLRIAIEKETLLVSLGAKLKVQKLKHIYDWFYNNDIANFGRPKDNLFLSYIMPDDFDTNKCVQDEVVKFFSSFDTSIIGFNVESDSDEISIETVHKFADSDETGTLPIESESAGTLKMFNLYPFLQNTLKNGGILFIDELNARLHPLLVRTFILYFLNPSINVNHAQLVFSSHDTWQLNSNLLRRDEIWFTEKNRFGVSSLYSLSDFTDEDGSKIRKDENYEKNYLLGKYGAIPSMKPVNILEESQDG